MADPAIGPEGTFFSVGFKGEELSFNSVKARRTWLNLQSSATDQLVARLSVPAESNRKIKQLRGLISDQEIEFNRIKTQQMSEPGVIILPPLTILYFSPLNDSILEAVSDNNIDALRAALVAGYGPEGPIAKLKSKQFQAAMKVIERLGTPNSLSLADEADKNRFPEIGYVLLGNSDKSLPSGGTSDDVLLGFSLNDDGLLDGNTGASVLLSGGANDDVLFQGGTGGDVIMGGNTDDVIGQDLFGPTSQFSYGTVGLGDEARNEYLQVVMKFVKGETARELAKMRSDRESRLEEEIGQLRAGANSSIDDLLVARGAELDERTDELVKVAKQSLNGTVNSFKEDANKTLAHFIGEKSAEFDAIKDAQKKEVGLDLAISLWDDLEKKHRWLAVGFGIGFTAFLLVALFGIYGSRMAIQAILTGPQVPESLTGGAGAAYLILQQAGLITLVGTPIVLTIWFLRVLLRQAMLNNRLMHDADMRSKIGRAFLHMRASNAIPEEVIGPAVNALFRPVTPHPLDDGLPENPFQWVKPKSEKKTNGGGS